jgi:hypothetical protein
MKKILSLLLAIMFFAIGAKAQTNVTYTRHQNVDDFRWLSDDPTATFDVMADYEKDNEPNGQIIISGWYSEGTDGSFHIFPYYTGHLKKKPVEYWVRKTGSDEWVEADRVPIVKVK